MNVLVTGAAGYLGRVMARVLHESGHTVTGTDLMHPGRVPYAFRVADLLRFDALYELIEGCEAVVHLANHPNAGKILPQRLYAENTSITMNVFQAAREMEVPTIIYASSIQVVSGDDNNHNVPEDAPAYLPLDGDLPPAANNIYSQSKLAGEALLAFQVYHGTRLGVALRLPCLVSAKGSRGRKFMLAKIAAKKTRLSIGTAAYLFEEDAARLVDGILRSGASGYRVLLPAAAGNLLGLSCTELHRRFYPQIPLRVAPEDFTALADLSAIHDIVPGWAAGHELDAPKNPLPGQE